MSNHRVHWLTKGVFAAVGISLLALASRFSTHEPTLRQRAAPWLPLAFSPDGQILAVADSSYRAGHSVLEPAGPIHLLHTSDLSQARPPVELPVVDTDLGVYHPPIEAVEFSPNGEILAVVQKHQKFELDQLELHLIRLSNGKVFQSLPIPFDRFHNRGGITQRLFSTDGQLLVWHEYSKDKERRDTVRIWDVTSGERFAIEAHMSDEDIGALFGRCFVRSDHPEEDQDAAFDLLEVFGEIAARVHNRG
jgi:hypothetical protein